MVYPIKSKAQWLMQLKLKGQDPLEKALNFAAIAHAGQFRKFGNIPYVEHPIRAYEILSEYSNYEPLKVATLLHDCVEDTYVTGALIEYKFGAEVRDIVELVTKSECENSYWNKLKHCKTAQTLKLADTLANTENLLEEAKSPKGYSFATRYLTKKINSLQFLSAGNSQLFKRVESKLNHLKLSLSEDFPESTENSNSILQQ